MVLLVARGLLYLRLLQVFDGLSRELLQYVRKGLVVELLCDLVFGVVFLDRWVDLRVDVVVKVFIVDQKLLDPHESL